MSSIETLKASFKGDIVIPGDPGYNQSIARWAKNTEKKAVVVAFVKNAEDVALALAYAQAANLQIAIKGGGHNVSGASSTEGGLVIDLSRHLNGVQVDAKKRVAYVGGGALWETVDKTAIEHGLATVGGTVNHTGVGGLTLGGGYGWLSGAHGLVIDNLVQATVVTADGRILTANDDENTDLFWGIRGAGSNFGVVTEFVLKLHPQRRTVYFGALFYSPDQLQPLLDVTQKWWENGPSEKEGILQGFTRGPDHKPCIVLMLFYNGSKEEGRENYKAFIDLNPIADHTDEIPYEALNGSQNHLVAPGQNAYMKGCFTSQSYRRDVLPRVFERLVELSESDEYMFIIMNEYFVLDKVNAVSDDATPYRRRFPPSVLFLGFAKKDGEDAFKHCRDSAHELLGIITDNSATNIGYGNYNANSEGMTELNFGSNYKRLQEIKKKYDPKCVFNKWFVIKPAA